MQYFEIDFRATLQGRLFIFGLHIDYYLLGQGIEN